LHPEQVTPIARDIIFERIGDCILVLDMENRVLDLNPAAEQLTGCRISDAFGLSIERIWPYQSTPMMPFNKMVKAGEELILERDGKQRTYAPRISAMNDAGGRPTSQVVLLTDITERKKLEKALWDEALRRRILVEQSRDGIVILDQDGKVYESNKQFAAMLGYSLEEVSQLYVYDWEYQFPREKVLEMIRIVDETGDHFESMHRRKDGTTYDVEISTNAATIEGQKLVFCICRNITERKLAEEKLVKSYESLKKTLDDSINTMVKIVEMKDPYTSGHQQKVADLATAIAREMKLEDTRIENLRTAAVIHDIGKMYIPSDILSKPGKLGDIEFSLIKTHAQSGYDIVKSMNFPCSIANTVLQHHERQDGSGYPNQLKGDDTLLEAKILAVADVIEAMTSHRPYRPALGIDKALEEISKNKGRLYDSDVVDTCLELFKSGKFEFKSI